MPVRVDDAANQCEHRVGDAQVGGRVVAEQQTREPQAFAVAARQRAVVHHVDEVAQSCGAHRFGQHAGGQRAVVAAEPGDDRAAHAAALALLRGGAEQYRARRAECAGVQAQVMADRQFAAHQVLVDQRFGARDRILLVVADEDRLRDLAQVHRLHPHLQHVARSLARD